MDSNYVYQTDMMSYETVYQINDQKAITDDDMQSNMAQLLTDLVEQGDSDHQLIEELKDFNSPKIPSISLYDYIGRILSQAQCSQECLILGLVYMERLSQKHKKIITNSINVHRLYVTCVMVAAKFYDDRFYQNQYYAKVAGICKDEFNALEGRLLVLLEFRLFIQPEVFFKYRQNLILAYQENI